MGGNGSYQGKWGLAGRMGFSGKKWELAGEMGVNGG